MKINHHQITPKFQVLNLEQINDIHSYSLHLLENTGIKVESKEALEIFRNSGEVIIKDDVVFLGEELINQAIKTAPSDIEIHGKEGDLAFHLGEMQGDETYFGIGVTNTWFQNIEGNEVEPFARKHMQHSVRLGDMLPHFDMVSTLGIPSDVSPLSADLYATLDMYTNTSKPLVLLIQGEDNINPNLELLSHLHGDISEKPFCIPYVNPITPLILNKDTSDKMISAFRYNLPVMYSNYGMYGGTTPATEAGTLTLLNAELLAGLVFSQLIKEGSKVILGSLPASFNMKTMGSEYTTNSYMINLACAEMMTFYKLPHCGTSGSSVGRGSDLLATGELWVNHLTSCMGKVGCAPFVGSNFSSMAFSPGNAVLSNYIIGETKKFGAGFSMNEKTINLEEIAQIGHGGNYFLSAETIASLDKLNNPNSIWSSINLDTWRNNGKPSVENELIDHANELYEKAKNKADSDTEVRKKGEEYISNSIDGIK